MNDDQIREDVGSVEISEGGVLTIHRAWYRQGYIFKSWSGFQAGGTCYVPELSDSLYTRDDFLAMCNDQEDIAESVFEAVDWQHPETYIEEEFAEGELDVCESCGKWYSAYGAAECPHCKHINPINKKWIKEKSKHMLTDAIK